MFSILYQDIIYRPILNSLVFLYNIIPGHDIGIVIILITIIIRVILAPSMQKSLRGQKQMNDLQPKLNALREKHKDDKEAQAKAMMELYREHKINPLSSCLPIVIQLPILIGLYQVLRQALNGHNLSGLYRFINDPGIINPKFIHLIDLSKPNVWFAVVAGLAQFWQSKMMMPKTENSDPTARIMAMQTTYILPVFSAFIALKLPAGLPLYWIVTTLFAVGQQYYIIKKTPKNI